MISLHADDFGYDSTVDEQMLKLLRGKKIAGVSVLSTMVSKVSLKKLANTTSGRKFPRIALHVNLTELPKKKNGYSKTNSPLKIRGVGGVMNDRRADEGLFPFVFKLFTRRISQKAVEREIESQLKILTSAGIKVTAIDSHQHVHALSPVAEAVVAVARKHKIKYIRSYRDISRFTPIAHIKYRILQIASFISHIAYHSRFGLPVTWKISGDSMAVMSWESGRSRSLTGSMTEPVSDRVRNSSRLNQVFGKHPKTNGPDQEIRSVLFITHPYLPFDSNTHYMKFIQKGGDTR